MELGFDYGAPVSEKLPGCTTLLQTTRTTRNGWLWNREKYATREDGAHRIQLELEKRSNRWLLEGLYEDYYHVDTTPEERVDIKAKFIKVALARADRMEAAIKGYERQRPWMLTFMVLWTLLLLTSLFYIFKMAIKGLKWRKAKKATKAATNTA